MKPRELRDLIRRLRAMSRHEHDDLSIGDEAADAIEELLREGGSIVETDDPVTEAWDRINQLREQGRSA